MAIVFFSGIWRDVFGIADSFVYYDAVLSLVDLFRTIFNYSIFWIFGLTRLLAFGLIFPSIVLVLGYFQYCHMYIIRLGDGRDRMGFRC